MTITGNAFGTTEQLSVMIDDGVKVWDDVAGHYTRCHHLPMSPMLQRAVEQNRKRQHEIRRARQLLRAAQLRYFEMLDGGELKRYHRIVRRCRKILNRKP